jgi:hypothetical protein
MRQAHLSARPLTRLQRAILGQLHAAMNASQILTRLESPLGALRKKPGHFSTLQSFDDI